MKVFVVSLRNLVWGAAAFCLVVAAGLFLLMSDPLNVSSPYQMKDDTVQTSTGLSETPFGDAVKPTLDLDVKVEGNTAEVKMITQNFQFTSEMDDMNQPQHGKGHAHLYLNGNDFGKLYEQEFLLKKLPKGQHEIKVSLTYSNHMPYNVEAVKTITVK